MNHLVLLDPQAGELEKILSGIKTMVLKEFDPSQSNVFSVSSGDCLYFLRDKDDCAIRVKATVVRVLPLPYIPDEDLSQTLKELQPKLQLTEGQYNYWSTKKQVLLVEFTYAQKIGLIPIASNQIKDWPGWKPFEEFGLIL